MQWMSEIKEEQLDTITGGNTSLSGPVINALVNVSQKSAKNLRQQLTEEFEGSINSLTEQIEVLKQRIKELEGDFQKTVDEGLRTSTI